MAAISDLIGIKSVDYTLARQVDLDEKVEVSEPLLDKDGALAATECGRTFNPTVSFSIRGRGDLPEGVLAGADIEITDLDGGRAILQTDRQSEAAGQWAEWETSGTYFPNVTPPA